MNDTVDRKIPPLGLGTAGRRGEEGKAPILDAIEIGYRHIDTAQNYGSEAGVGWAVRESRVPRQEFFITTKVADSNLAKADFRPSLERSLETLAIDQVDLTLIHWPSEDEAVPLEDYMTELVRAQEDGLTRLIGVSNFTIDLIGRSIATIGDGKISTNQVEVHPYLQNRKLHEFCMNHGIPLTGYQPLAKGRVANDAVLHRIGEHHQAAATQIALAFLLHRGVIAIPASSQRQNLETNFQALDIALSSDEIEEISGLDRGQRFIDPAKAPAWD